MYPKAEIETDVSLPQTAVNKSRSVETEGRAENGSWGTHNYKADLIKGEHVFLQCPTAAILSVNRGPKYSSESWERPGVFFLLEN